MSGAVETKTGTEEKPREKSSTHKCRDVTPGKSGRIVG